MNIKTNKRQNSHCRLAKHSLNSFFGAFLSVSLLTALVCLPQCKNDNKSSSSNSGENPPIPPTPLKAPNPACSLEADAATGFNKGDGMKGSPFLICTYEQLDMIRADLIAHYQLGNNFNASGKGNWTPIGGTPPFTGSLDGDGYLIRNLTVNITVSSGTAYGGFFGYINGAVISNIALRDVSITVKHPKISQANVGGLVGDVNGGTISNSYVTGGPGPVISTLSTAISAGGTYVGGLVGSLSSGGTISNSYAGASVAVLSQGNPIGAGGLVGNVGGGTINNSYATGHATCDDTGSCKGTLSLGGLVGQNNGTIRDSYWDIESTQHTAGCGGSGGCAGAMGLRTAQMQDGSSAALGDGFQISGGGSYPKLYLCEIDSTTNGCSGSFSTELLPGQ